MSTSDRIALASALIAVVALAFSGWAAASAHRAVRESRRLADIESERREVEREAEALRAKAERLANLHVELVLYVAPRHGFEGLAVVKNRGPHTATAVQIELLRPRPFRISPADGAPMPQDIEPAEQARYKLTPLPSDGDRMWIRLRWSDGEGDHENERETYVRTRNSV